MTNSLRWIMLVGRLVVAYTIIGASGALASLAVIAAYAYPTGAATFLLGVVSAVAGFFVRRTVRRFRKANDGYSFAASVHAFMSEDDFPHHDQSKAA